MTYPSPLLYPGATVFPSGGLPPRSVEADGLLIGPGTPYVVTSIAAGGKPAGEVGDKPRPREDGDVFGRDPLRGRLIPIELTIDTDSYLACQAAWAALSTVWDAERVRDAPGAVIPLRIRQFDGATRTVFGRPNRIDPANEELMDLGRLDVVLDFRCGDHKFYSEERTTTVGIVPPPSGGLQFPLTFPLATTGRAEGVGAIIVAGDVAAWVAVTPRGPITTPVAVVAGQWEAQLDLALTAGQYVTVDPQPWSRRVRRDGFANVSGKLTQSSPYLSEMRVPPGTHDVLLRGIDATGTASMTVAWRDAHLTL